MAEHAHPAPLEVTQLRRLWRWGSQATHSKQVLFFASSRQIYFSIKGEKEFQEDWLEVQLIFTARHSMGAIV